PAAAQADCACPKNAAGKQICGSDGQTYNNDCLAACAGASVAHEGQCAADCTTTVCSSIYAPVCGTNGKTYSSACIANCAKVDVASKGECDSVKGRKNDTCPCPKKLDPVRVNIAYNGNCADPDGCKTVKCSATGNPVCGFNGVQYRNDCLASCTGVSFKRSPCKGAVPGRALPPSKKSSPPPRSPPRPKPPAPR
ncbi:Serine protease inhibitor dipetalogastin, partial [Tetrabaena socialis]